MRDAKQAEWSARIVVSDTGPSIVSPADGVLALMATDKNVPETRLKWIQAAASIDDRCPAVFAKYAELLEENGHDRRDALRRAVDLGWACWDRYGEARMILWWDMSGTRPHMQALYDLGECCLALGEFDEARACFRWLVKMDLKDRMGARSKLANIDHIQAHIHAALQAAPPISAF